MTVSRNRRRDCEREKLVYTRFSLWRSNEACRSFSIRLPSDLLRFEAWTTLRRSNHNGKGRPAWLLQPRTGDDVATWSRLIYSAQFFDDRVGTNPAKEACCCRRQFRRRPGRIEEKKREGVWLCDLQWLSPTRTGRLALAAFALQRPSALM